MPGTKKTLGSVLALFAFGFILVGCNNATDAEAKKASASNRTPDPNAPAAFDNPRPPGGTVK